MVYNTVLLFSGMNFLKYQDGDCLAWMFISWNYLSGPRDLLIAVHLIKLANNN